MVMVTVPVPEHPLDVPVTVYVVVAEGYAFGLAITVLLNPVAGSQLYEVAPEAVSAVLVPPQMDVAPLTVITGAGITDTVTVLVDEQLPVVPVTV